MTNDYDDLCKRLRDPNASRVYGLAGSRTCNEAADAIAALRAENDHLLRCVKAADDVTSASAMELMRERAEKAEADNAALQPLLTALRHIDWIQIILNQSPPCCFIEKEDGRFCGRAERWAGHEHFHKFISLNDAIDAALLAGKKP